MMKRYLDVLGALVLLAALSPLFLAVALCVRVSMGPPVFFRQRRPGLNGRPFELLKFRSMIESGGESGGPLPDDKRLTGFGRWLRRTSLDELPELINVLRGEMSLVGPRPLLMEYLPLYSSEQARRHAVRPGLTGWAQVNGRNAISWEEKFTLDVWYVDNRTMKLDLKILSMTLMTVLRAEGIGQRGRATTDRFQGTGT